MGDTFSATGSSAASCMTCGHTSANANERMDAYGFASSGTGGVSLNDRAHAYAEQSTHVTYSYGPPKQPEPLDVNVVPLIILILMLTGLTIRIWKKLTPNEGE